MEWYGYVLLVAGLLIVAFIFFLIGMLYRKKVAEREIGSAETEATRIINEAIKGGENKKREMLVEAKEEIHKSRTEYEKEVKERRADLQKQERRLQQKEESLDKKLDAFERKEDDLRRRQANIAATQDEVEMIKKSQLETLEKLSGLTQEEAKNHLLKNLENECKHDAALKIKEIETNLKDNADQLAREIISIAIQRCAADQAGEITVTSVHIPSDDLKGRIIGREGRNIRTFEQVSGVSLVIDDTPETVVLSSFDPVRRETARVALENLIADGRIHPARIEELYKKAEALVAERVREAGEQAAFDAGIHDLHPELVKTLGALRYRTSFGQNVLSHSIQVSALCGIMASELGLDEAPAKRAGLLHDLGKAIDHEVEGPHAVIGADLARRYGERPEIVHAIEAHHNDVEANSVVDVLIQAADAVSAARPGARKETLDAYVKRLEKLEEIANSHKGVERTYAIQAGREVRVMVEPEVVDEAESVVLAHDIAQQIENEMQYPGQVKVVVIRESRAVDYAK